MIQARLSICLRIFDRRTQDIRRVDTFELRDSGIREVVKQKRNLPGTQYGAKELNTSRITSFKRGQPLANAICLSSYLQIF